MEDSRKTKKRYAEIEEEIHHDRKPSFSETLVKFFDKREAEVEGLTDADIYNSVNLNRSMFCRIKNNRDYTTSKETAIVFAVALHLNLDETQELLASAGFTLSDSLTSDLIVKYFIEKEDYDCNRIDWALEHFHQTGLFEVKSHKTKNA